MKYHAYVWCYKIITREKLTVGVISIQNGLDLEVWFITSLLIVSNRLHFTYNCHKRDSQPLYIRQTTILALTGS